MLKNTYHVLGVMSGTSLDGLDIAQINFRFLEGQWHYKLGVCVTVAYSEDLRVELKNLATYNTQELAQQDYKFTEYLGQQINHFIKQNTIKDLDAICSHGHTALHEPEKGLTKQIGNQALLAQLIGIPVVCDFRVQDVALGGQGAPLVPIGDELLFKQYDYCLNLGGFANVSYQHNNERIAYDLCPVNIVMNPIANALGLPYDQDGQLARSGTLLMAELDRLNALAFYSQPPPKSLGVEWVNQVFWPELNANHHKPEDLLRTLIEHIAMQIATPLEADKRILVTGGGAYNTYLLERIRFYKSVALVIPEPKLLEFKEALIFGLLGVLKLRGEVNCLASVTGAKHNHSAGILFMP